MVRKVIIAYRLEGVKTPLKITRAIYGYIEHSNNNQYQYKRKGILSNVKYEKLSRACIMLAKKDASPVIKAMKQLGITMAVLDVELKKRQRVG